MFLPRMRFDPDSTRARSAAALRRLLLATLSLLLSVGPAAAAAEGLIVGGAGSGLGAMRVLAAEFAKVAPGVTVTVLPSLGSNGGVKALRAGVINLAVISRPLTSEERAQGLVAVEYGRTPFVFVTSKDGAPDFKSIAELADVVAGRRSAWPDGSPIRVVMQNRTDGNTVLLAALSPKMGQAVQSALTKRGAIITAYGESAAEAVENTPGAIGTSALALVLTSKRRLHVLPINGVAPTPAAVVDGTYPYSKTMYLVHNAANTAAGQRFVDFVASAKGRKVLVGTGHLVADAGARR